MHTHSHMHTHAVWKNAKSHTAAKHVTSPVDVRPEPTSEGLRGSPKVQCEARKTNEVSGQVFLWKR